MLIPVFFQALFKLFERLHPKFNEFLSWLSKSDEFYIRNIEFEVK